MPRIQRSHVPRPLFAHLLQRIQERGIRAEDLERFVVWLDENPEVPTGDWFKRFPSMIVCGHGALVKTFFEPTQTPVGDEQ